MMMYYFIHLNATNKEHRKDYLTLTKTNINKTTSQLFAGYLNASFENGRNMLCTAIPCDEKYVLIWHAYSTDVMHISHDIFSVVAKDTQIMCRCL